ncbi:MAG: hypothetical protein JNK28_15330 [Burkholderiaceae bacterium]|nr:hypothetical protein [Burkholderiaceae bacterium]
MTPGLAAMRWRMRLAAVALCLGTTSGATFAQRLDDSASPRQTIQAPQVHSERGLSLADDEQARFAVLSFGRIEYKLATAAYKGRRARIDLVIPAVVRGLMAPDGLQLRWRGGRLFADGEGRGGERVPVWSGIVADAWMIDTLELTARLELRKLDLRDTSFGFESYFQIEVLP